MASGASSRNFTSVQDFVESCGGTRAINKILIANNGVGAVKAIRSIRRWAYEMFGNERIISFVVMATPEDMRANAEYIRMADEIVDVPGGSNNNNYANVMLIVEIAERWAVDAVWAGWGHASENPLLPDSLERTDRKIVFIGPSGAPMRALGDKIGSTIIAQSAGVPCIGWNGDSLKCDYRKTGIPDEVYAQANVTTVEDCQSECERVGFPIMIKASEGGGGKGIRKVTKSEEVAMAYRQVQSEIPGSPIFVMKLAPRARHLEVQLLADAYGTAIALNGRDCSVQRRHQKIIEEGPPVAADAVTWKQMEDAAVALATEVSYCNAGTVEYLFCYDDDHNYNGFYFLELNPRLQVEHPVTEMITGVNLPACQLQVAMGLPLHRIPDIRRLYGQDRFGSDNIDFTTAERMPPTNHCIAVRVTAENPDQGFQPTSGTIQELNFRSTPDVWGYFSVDSSGLVHEFADSQFGHLFANGADRDAARKNMVMALKELSIRGDIRTTTEFIIEMIESPAFMDNMIDTAWLDKRLASLANQTLERVRPDPLLVVVCGALVTFKTRLSEQHGDFVDLVKKGQYPAEDMLEVEMGIDLIYENIKYSLTCAQAGAMIFTVACNGSYVQANMRSLADGGFLINVGGRSHNAYYTNEATGMRLTLDGQTCIFSKEYDPTRLTTDVAGKFARMLVPEGAHVDADQPYAEIEVMKMFMALKAGEAGVVHWRMQEGAAMTAGDLLAEMELDHPELVQRAELFTGVIPDTLQQVALNQADKPHILLRQALAKLDMVMLGYAVPADQYNQAMNDLGDALSDPMLPLLEFEEALSVLNGRIDAGLGEGLSALCTEYRSRSEKGTEFPISAVVPMLDAHAASLDERDRGAFTTQVGALRAVADAYGQGVAGRSVTALLALVRQYLQVERAFNGLQYADAVTALRSQHRGDDASNVIFEICRSHASLQRKNALLLALLDHVRTAAESSKAAAPAGTAGGMSRGLRSSTSLASLLDVQSSSGAFDMKDFHPVLTELATFGDKAYGVVSLEARKLLIEQNLPSLEERRSKLQTALDAILTTSPVVGFAQRVEKMETFLRTNVPVRDVLPEFLSHDDANMRLATLELYIRKIYQTHSIQSITGEAVPSAAGGDLLCVGFEFYTKAAEALPAGVSMSATSSFLDLSQMASKSSSLSLAEGDVSDASDLEGASYSKIPPNVARHGAFFRCSSWAQAQADFTTMIGRLPATGGGDLVNCLHVAIMDEPVPLGDDVAAGSHLAREDAFVRLATEFLAQHNDALVGVSARRVTFMVFLQPKSEGVLPAIFTFRARDGFQEDQLFRNIEPSYAFQLDLLRLTNFHIRHCEALQTQSGNVHVYSAVPKRSLAAAAGLKGPLSERVFVRVVSITSSYESTESERLFVESLNALELKLAESEASAAKGKPAPALTQNHIFVNIVAPTSVVEPASVEGVVRTLMTRYHDKLTRLGVAHVELKMVCRLGADQAPMPLRVVASNPTGFVLHTECYVERRDAASNKFVFSSIGGKPGIWDGKDVTAPYELIRPFERQRAAALASSDTLFCYDYLELFAAAVERTWEEHEARCKGKQQQRPAKLFEAVELVVTRKSSLSAGAPAGKWTLADAEAGLLELVQTPRAPGQNDVGMVAWLMTLRTPEYPEGRQMVVISNDITFIQGSFGTREDWVFRAASEYARECRIPRLYLAANSGARINIAKSVRDLYKVCWVNDADPAQGFKYLYLTPEDYATLDAKNAAKAQRMYEGEEERYLLTDVIGEEPDLGVENLRGSGMIAGETSKAYKDIFTLTLVTGRTVGIGAYLVRLGQRTIQKTGTSPIILTGYQALNKLMGKSIYTSNDQLGGPMIMHPNGVSHVLVDDHLGGVMAAVKWLSYVPSVRGMPLPIVDITGVDMVERPVQFYPKKGEAYDPRLLLTGMESELDGQWVSGFFDRGSFTETLAGWAKTVIVGRGRLGGIPMGVIVTENRTVECLTPADPADPTSTERAAFQAGGVWFPDSAYKTAQAINDFNSEDLPILILANWRGFSGGQRDMFDEVLKFGAQIVDALVAFSQPIFVYIPPFAELRGGAWVVVDSTINPNVMEFFAAEDSRGGVLEADALASIKYRRKDLEATAHRLDPELIALDQQLAAEGLSDEAKADLADQIRKREAHLMGIYQQIAVQFADLHDTPARMESTGVIVSEVPWASSRSYFYWRLRRRLAEFQLRQQIVKYDTNEMTAQAASGVIRQWFLQSGQPADKWDDSKFVLAWMADKQQFLREQLEGLRRCSVEAQARELAMDCPEAAARGLVAAFQQMDYMQREILRQQLQSIR